MSDEITSSEEHEPAVVRAMWFYATRRGMLRAGLTPPTFAPLLGYSVSADEERFAFTGKRSREPFMTIRTERILSIAVGETQPSYVYREGPELAILLEVDGPRGPAMLPVVPISDDGRRRLNWQVSTVRVLAERLADASGVELVGRPKRVRRSLPDWTQDV